MTAPPSPPSRQGLLTWETAFSLLRFGASGGLSFGLNLGLTEMLVRLAGWGPEYAFALVLATVMVFNFFMVKFFVFRNRSQGPLWKDFLVYLTSSGVFRGGEYIAFLIIYKLTDIHHLIVITMVLGTSFLTKFVFYRYWFSRKPGSPPAW